MTQLSVNINKVALLRNSRGHDTPNVRDFAEQCLQFGAHGITLHPRPDQRHARYSDVPDLKVLCKEHGAELNVEGYPSAEFLAVVLKEKPDQCTLVPDAPGQLTSDHGWKIREEEAFLRKVAAQLKDQGIRVSLFVDYDEPALEAAKNLGADRVELYTEPYAAAYGSSEGDVILEGFRLAASRAQKSGLGVNAGHDLSLRNLARFLSIPRVLEVSIGHALIVESLQFGLKEVIRRYLGEIKQAEESHHTAV